ncbi:TIGR04326 family surface carbohydrate biosynthesis protein [Candidatus Desulfovibrio trichonymphae]|uniref:TIGR04326 family surface carbohydrate biosynthesis protein n=1 Tax=Candidatus Desulfovibrio trichonymphae TaxID=1725232 RepID=UPI001E48615B|nr:TIGR04326 family surface carbohydrate biosynthesis protein [Candidatus Desulfovibrio trichonymphae]GHU91331.1 hypothetical protein AGMMS49925_05960 [Deltaproteobacteria bacterium]
MTALVHDAGGFAIARHVVYKNAVNELLLLAGTGMDRSRARSNAAPERLVVRFDAWDVPQDEISLPAFLQNELLQIRAEHAAWAYDFARLRVNGREVQEYLRCGESLSFWWCSLIYERHPKMTPGLYTIYRLRVLERLMDAREVTALRLRGGNRRLARSLAAMCAASGRTFAQENTDDMRPDARPPASGIIARLYRLCPAPVRAMARLAHWWWSVRRKLPFAGHAPLPHAQGQSASIVTYFPNIDMDAAQQGRFRSRYFESLHNALNAHGGGRRLRWLFIRFPVPDFDLDRCIALRDQFRKAGKDGLSFHYLEEFLSTRDILAALLRYARLTVASLRLERHVRAAFCFAGSRLNFRDRLAVYWAESFRGWLCLERCLQQRAFNNWVRLSGPQRWTLFPLENCPWERMLTHAVHEAGAGPVFGTQHSVIRPADFRYFDDPRAFSAPDCAAFQPDELRGNGHSACAQWLEAGVPARRLGKVEALRYLYLTKKTQNDSSKTPPLPYKQLLVVTSFFADETRAHLALLAKALRAGLLDEFAVVVKPHPYLPVRKILHELLGARAEQIQEAGGPIAAHLLPGVHVWASNSTTAALEAAIMGLPVMAMPPFDDFDLCPLQDAPGLPRTIGLAGLRRALAEAVPLPLAPDYLELNPELPLWRELLFAEKPFSV